MKKFLSILIAGFIGFLGIFTTTSTAKNSAEPQYFLQNERKNAIIYNENDMGIKVFFDPSLEYNDSKFLQTEVFKYSKDIDNNNFYYYDLNYNKIKYNNIFTNSGNSLSVYFSANDANYANNQISFYTKNFEFIVSRDKFDSNQNYKLIVNEQFIDNILGFEFEQTLGIESNVNFNQINTFIGNISNPPSKNTTIEQIGNIIDDTTNWFVNIFIGLSDIFYSNGSLGVWGAVLFLGVAFTLITMCLKWVISLIRGI